MKALRAIVLGGFLSLEACARVASLRLPSARLLYNSATWPYWFLKRYVYACVHKRLPHCTPDRTTGEPARRTPTVRKLVLTGKPCRAGARNEGQAVRLAVVIRLRILALTPRKSPSRKLRGDLPEGCLVPVSALPT